MSKIKIILIIGVWVAVLPYLGFPYYIKDILFTLSGLLTLYFGYFLYKELSKEESFDNFSENKDEVQ